MEEVTNCRRCNSTDIVKEGAFALVNPYWDTQKYLCNSCNRNFNVRVPKGLIKKPELNRNLTVQNILNETKKEFSWPAYNESQKQEKLIFLEILDSLCSHIPDEPEGKMGRPSARFREMIFCIVTKLYEGLSTRIVCSDLTIAMEKGYIAKVPNPNTLIKYFNQPQCIAVLTDLIRLSAMPLKGFETTFSVDATGLSSAFYSRWFDHRFGKEDEKKDWRKIHLICGNKTHIVTAIVITDGKSHDSPQFCELVNKTAEHFRILEVCADKAYSSRKNVQAVADVGGTPIIPFRSNSTGRSLGSKVWNKLFYYTQYHGDEFTTRYGKRNNVEGTFSSLKRKFSTKLLCKNEIAQVNECLAMVLCLNICILVRALFEHAIETNFEEFAHIFRSLNIKSTQVLK